MRAVQFVSRAVWSVAFLLGQASALLGVMLTIGWSLAFAFILPQKAGGWAGGPHLVLPLEPPLIGLALGVLGLWMSRWCRGPTSVVRFAVAGLVLNTLPLLLSLYLLSLQWKG